MDNNNENTTNEHMTMKFITDIQLWETLFSYMPKKMAKNKYLPNHDKLTEPEAFYDIVHRHNISLITNNDDVINESILGLSERWGWTRYSTKQFLKKLEDIGAISISLLDNRTIVRLNHTLEANAPSKLNSIEIVSSASSPDGVSSPENFHYNQENKNSSYSP